LSGVDVVIQGGDGANNQSYPSEIAPTGAAVAVFDYPTYQYGGVAFQDDTYGIVYLAFGFEAINNAPDRTDVMSKTLAWLGGCESSSGWLVGQVTDAATGDPIAEAEVTVTPSVGRLPIDGLTDPNGHYTFTLPAGIYDVTAAKAGYDPQTVPGVQVEQGMTTTQDFALLAACEPIAGLAFSWEPVEPVAGQEITFSATATGTAPLSYAWAFGDGTTGSGATVEHTYADSGLYSVVVTATNACDTQTLQHDITVEGPYMVYLPVIFK